MITRRRFLRATAVASGLGLGVGGYTWRWEPHWVEIVERSLPVANLPERLQGVRVVQLSDLHIGPQVEDAYLMRSGFWPGTPTGGNASRHFFRRHCCRFKIGDIPPASSRFPEGARCTSIAALGIYCVCDSTCGLRSRCFTWIGCDRDSPNFVIPEGCQLVAGGRARHERHHRNHVTKRNARRRCASPGRSL